MLRLIDLPIAAVAEVGIDAGRFRQNDLDLRLLGLIFRRNGRGARVFLLVFTIRLI